MAIVGDPILCNICYCDDCQSGAKQIEALSGGATVTSQDGGTPYLLFRKDRISIGKGYTLLKAFKLKDDNATNRHVATCCNSAMYMDFEDSRH